MPSRRGLDTFSLIVASVIDVRAQVAAEVARRSMLRSAVSSSTPVQLLQVGRLRVDEELVDRRNLQVADQAQVDAHPHAGEQVHRLFAADRLRGAENAVGAADAVVQVSWLSRTRKSRALRS